ncbi:MAG: tRNA (cytidine(34)-2'-O)-methyltransferase [Defluviitaleaceae bacterium]|nr:tRNA (cytidine(34)-2'-O)-methyltransferase [Defluviitaleaceae bacterium]
MHIVLYEPEIPHNTGAIGRTCVCTGTALHLIRPLGFSMDEKHIRRTGLDYWADIELYVHDCFADFEGFMAHNFPQSKLWLVETTGEHNYTDAAYGVDDFIMLGKETTGIPQFILEKYGESSVYVPMINNKRSLNLSVTAGIVLYEIVRQKGLFRL